jgi:hypothetical protein
MTEEELQQVTYHNTLVDLSAVMKRLVSLDRAATIKNFLIFAKIAAGQDAALRAWLASEMVTMAAALDADIRPMAIQ